jgi:hypothetical protein
LASGHRCSNEICHSACADGLEEKGKPPQRPYWLYHKFPEVGLEVLYSDQDKARLIIFFVKSREYVAVTGQKTRTWDGEAFKGRTNKGIGLASTITQVESLYGEPSRKSESSMGNLRATDLEYDHLGISFTFYDRELSDIRVFPAVHPPPQTKN